MKISEFRTALRVFLASIVVTAVFSGCSQPSQYSKKKLSSAEKAQLKEKRKIHLQDLVKAYNAIESPAKHLESSFTSEVQDAFSNLKGGSIVGIFHIEDIVKREGQYYIELDGYPLNLDLLVSDHALQELHGLPDFDSRYKFKSVFVVYSISDVTKEKTLIADEDEDNHKSVQIDERWIGHGVLQHIEAEMYN